ncbi:Wadjet anti-phage system protein JetD domain-containing protein [Kitasatospora griseola]|uniref:Wadjet anti-phage system protein JetD domain-containing protein n=1 Tax=Kitasatospora griseola TaxID=2064 RepID=UPI00343DFC7F
MENGGKLDRMMPFEMSGRQRGDLLDLFGAAAVSARSVHLGRADAALRAGRYGVSLRLLLIGVDGPLITRRARARYRAMVRRERIRNERADLLARITPVPELRQETALLAALPDGDTWPIPAASATGSGAWSTYSAALKAAAEWYAGRSRGWKFAERELAVRALGGSKRWTVPTKAAFSRLIRVPFDEAVHITDAVVRMKGPAVWNLEYLVADTGTSAPFVGLPGRAVAQTGRLDIEARGVLLIENQETFEAVGRTGVPREWLCVWMEGFVSGALAELVSRIPDVPLVAWADLDPAGIGIITDLSARSGRTVRPVAMDPSTYHSGYMLEEEPEYLEKWRVEADELVRTAPEELRPLAAAIAANGGRRCEQEGLHEAILPQLALLLEEVAGASPR